MVPALHSFGSIGSSAEQRVAELLAQVEMDSPATAYYSVHLPEHEYKRMSEVDFVVVLNDCVVAIEVKGGRVSRDGGSWKFTNRYGDINLKREGPFDQARSGMFALQKRLEAAVPELRSGFAFLVVTPDQQLPNDVEWQVWDHAGPSSMTVNGLRNAIQSAVSHVKHMPVRGTGNAHKVVSSILRPDFDRVPRLDYESGKLERGYVALLASQYAVIRSADDNERLMCEGGAGTGKTLLAAEVATRDTKLGSSVIFTCRSHSVLAYVSELVRGTAVRCVPFNSLAGEEAADVLVVDEAQDLMNAADLAVLDNVLIGGLDGGSWRIFCDTNNQAHVDGEFDQEMLQMLEANSARLRLRDNCRNTSPVVRQTQLLVGADLGTPLVGAGPAVITKEVVDDEAASQALDERLASFVGQGIELEDIAIVSLCPDASLSIAARTSHFRRGRIHVGQGTNRGSARLYTVSQIKGLEAAHVCVVDIDDLDVHGMTFRLYVAMTRPRISLWMAMSSLVWAQLKTRYERKDK